jgi:lipooligosaccharide transport system permease protein
VTLVLRLIPPGVRVRRPQRMFERHAAVYRRQWIIIVSGFFEPLFFLLSMRAGLGDLVGTVSFAGRELPYDSFVAPGLMAASAMNGAVFDSTGNVFGRLKQMRIYDAVLATPMEPVDVALGEIGWAVLRGQIYSVSFLAVMVAMGLTESWWALSMLPICALISLAFASLGFCCTTFMRSWADLEIVNTAVMPMFLFSATFFPVSAYGSWAWTVQLSPLYHGVALVRMANSGAWSSTAFLHVAVLLVLSIVALVVATKRVDRLLRR